MLARTSRPFHSDQYLYEIKWDGERIIAFAENGRIKKFQNQKRMDVSRKFPEIINYSLALPRDLHHWQCLAMWEF